MILASITKELLGTKMAKCGEMSHTYNYESNNVASSEELRGV